MGSDEFGYVQQFDSLEEMLKTIDEDEKSDVPNREILLNKMMAVTEGMPEDWRLTVKIELRRVLTSLGEMNER